MPIRTQGETFATLGVVAAAICGASVGAAAALPAAVPVAAKAALATVPLLSRVAAVKQGVARLPREQGARGELHGVEQVVVGDALPPLQEPKRVVCIGDSLTHGTVGAGWTDDLQRSLGPGYRVLNAGRNSELVFNMNLRLEPIVRMDPHHVVLLVGTNDFKCLIRDDWKANSRKSMNLPQEWDLAFFEREFCYLLRALLRRTGATLTVLTLPFLGEGGSADDDEAFAFMDKHANPAIRRCVERVLSGSDATPAGCRAQPAAGAPQDFRNDSELVRDYETFAHRSWRGRLSVADLHGALVTELQRARSSTCSSATSASSRRPAPYDAWSKMGVETCCVLRYGLRTRWETTSRVFGFHLLSEGLHLNERAARVVHDTVLTDALRLGV